MKRKILCFFMSSLLLTCFSFFVLGAGKSLFSSESTAVFPAPVAKQTLCIGAIPIESIDKTRDQLQPLMEFIERKTDFTVKLIVTTDYQSVIDKMRAKEIDIAMLGPFSYVIAHKEARAQAFASTDNSETGKGYYSVFIAHPDSGIENISQIKGRRLGFTDRDSTSGYLIPKAMLIQHNIDPDKDLAAVKFFRHHDAAILAVKKRLVDAAAVSSTVLQSMREKGLIGSKDYRIIQMSEVIPGSGAVWAYREGLSAELISKVKDAFFSANKEEGALGIFATEVGIFFPVEDREYDVIRSTYHMLGMDEE